MFVLFFFSYSVIILINENELMLVVLIFFLICAVITAVFILPQHTHIYIISPTQLLQSCRWLLPSMLLIWKNNSSWSDCNWSLQSRLNNFITFSALLMIQKSTCQQFASHFWKIVNSGYSLNLRVLLVWPECLCALICWTLAPKVMVLGGRPLGRALVTEISAIIRDPSELASPFYHVKCIWSATYDPEGGPHQTPISKHCDLGPPSLLYYEEWILLLITYVVYGADLFVCFFLLFLAVLSLNLGPQPFLTLVIF
jgi:hypothetical protein